MADRAPHADNVIALKPALRNSGSGFRPEMCRDISSRQVSEIIATIEEILVRAQSLLLAACAEVATSGNTSREFALMVSEITALAKRSSEAANRIKRLSADGELPLGQRSSLMIEASEVLAHTLGRLSEINAAMSASMPQEADNDRTT